MDHCAISAKNGDGMLPSSPPPASPSTAVTSSRVPRPAHRGHQQSSLLGQQRRAHRRVLGDTVQHVQQSLRAQHSAARNSVGPQPFLQAGDDDQVPLVAERRVRAEHRDLLGRHAGSGPALAHLLGRR